MLDVNKPTDQEIVSAIPSFIREDRAAINAASAGAGFGSTSLNVAGGATFLSVGVDLLAVGYEVIFVVGFGVSTLISIHGGTEGQIKTFVFQDSNVKLTDGVKSNGKFYLNQLPALGDFEPQQDDIITVVNKGGDGASVYGYWKELYRCISIK
jgi:hypothetical protein